MQVTKYVLPVVVGAMSGMILITVGENAIHHAYPMPPGTDPYEVESLAKYIGTLPANAFVMMMANYIICSYLAGIISTLISKGETNRPAVVIGIVLTLAGLYYVVNMPYPRWFAVVDLFIYLPFTYLGYLTVRKKAVISE